MVMLLLMAVVLGTERIGMVLMVVVLGLGACSHWAQAGNVDDGGGAVTDGSGCCLPLLG